MKMDAGLDTGPILTQRHIAIAPDETGESLHDKLAEVGGDLLIATLPGYLDGSITPQPQDGAQSTYAPMIKKEEGNIDWTQSAVEIERLIRAFTPWPGTYTFWNGQQLKILRGATGPGSEEPGLVSERARRVAIGTGDGLFYPLQVQLAGRAAVEIDAFVRGRPDFTGSRLAAS
jgi:methionyl-tRNA formyltransferase